MNLAENIDARLSIMLAILSPFFPEVTREFLKENLPECDAIWRLAASV